MSILIKIYLLITNMLIFSRLEASFLVKTAEMPTLRCGAAGSSQQAKQVQAGQGLSMEPKALLQTEGHGRVDNLFSG